MKQLLTFVVAVIAITANVARADFTRIKSENQFRKLVVGKTIATTTGYSIANADGTIIGKYGKKKFSGSWKWGGKYFCRNGVLGGEEIGSDCLVFEIDGNKVRYTREKGKGLSIKATLK